MRHETAPSDEDAPQASSGHPTFNVSVRLFGSHKLGRARPDSDIDVMLVENEMVRLLLPRPIPHDEPGFYDPDTPPAYHHQRKREWSHQLWERLGGDAGVARLFDLAAAHIATIVEPFDRDKMQLFLYVPESVSPQLWAIHLAWADYNAHLDFACAMARCHAEEDATLATEVADVMRGDGGNRTKAKAIDDLLRCRVGVGLRDEYRRYRSLTELRRGVGRYADGVAATGLD